MALIREVSELKALPCKEAIIVLRKDSVFLPKVVSAFYLNQDIVFPFLCLAPNILRRLLSTACV